MTIEPLLKKDLPLILSMEQDLYVKPWTKEDFLYELEQNPFASYFKVVENKQIIGYFGFWITFVLHKLQKYPLLKIFKEENYRIFFYKV